MCLRGSLTAKHIGILIHRNYHCFAIPATLSSVSVIRSVGSQPVVEPPAMRPLRVTSGPAALKKQGYLQETGHISSCHGCNSSSVLGGRMCMHPYITDKKVPSGVWDSLSICRGIPLSALSPHSLLSSLVTLVTLCSRHSSSLASLSLHFLLPSSFLASHSSTFPPTWQS
jgi:hypothetical protein